MRYKPLVTVNLRMKAAPPSRNQRNRNCSVSGSVGEARGTRLPKTEMTTFQSGADEVVGFLALPPFPGRHRAVIAIHEWWGLTGWVKEQAENLAANGYVVLAVDLYRGRVTRTRSKARELKRGLPAAARSEI